MDDTAVTPVLVLRAVLELLFVLGVLGFLLFATDLRRRLHPLGTSALAVLFCFLGAWGAVQMADRWQYDYPQQLSFVPLTRFAMYQAQLSTSVEESYSWQATLVDGTRREVNIAEEFETVGLPPLSTRMRVLLQDLDEPTGSSDREAAETELELFAQGLDASLRDDGVEVSELSFSRVTGSPEDTAEEILLTWPAERLRGDG